MSAKLKNVEQLIESIKRRFPDYLIAKGIIQHPDESFSCLHPDHEDTNPSCGLVAKSGYEVAHCFSCGRTFNIFAAAEILEGLPSRGDGFLNTTLVKLAETLDIPVDTEEMSEHEQLRYRIRKIYQDAADYITENLVNNKRVAQEVIARGWGLRSSAESGVGAVPSRTHFVSTMESLGYTTSELETAGIISTTGDPVDMIFQPDSLIFTLRNSTGHPIAFAARRLNTGGPKYVNTAGSPVDPTLFRKGAYLYGVEGLKDRTAPVYVVEGYADVITLRRYGLTNVVATCGAALRDEQIQYLTNAGYRSLILALDNDKAGLDAMERAIDMLKFRTDITVRVLDWGQADKTDPDEFVRTHGINAFKQLPTRSVLAIKLQQAVDSDDVHTAMESVMPILLNERSAVRREQMMREVSAAIGISHTAIAEEVRARLDAKEGRMRERIQSAIFDAMNQAKYHPGDAEGILLSTIDAIRNIQHTYGVTSVDAEAILNRVIEWNNTVISGEAGNKLDWGVFDSINRVLDADITNGYMLAIGGHPNTGKSALVISMMMELLKRNSNLMVVFATVDDSFERTLPRILRNMVHDPNNLVTIRDLRDVAKIRDPKYKEYVMERRQPAMDALIKLVQDERLIAFDRANGGTFPYLYSTVHQYRQKYPERDVIVFLDNFHKLNPTVGKNDDLRVGFRKLSSDIKAMTETLHVGVVMTVEYNKVDSSVEPRNSDIAETGKLLYDITGLIHLINDLDARKEDAQLYHYDTTPSTPDAMQEVMKLPTIRLRFGKAKDQFFKGNLFYDFFPHHGRFVEVPHIQVQERLNMYASGLVPDEITAQRKRYLAKRKRFTQSGQ